MRGMKRKIINIDDKKCTGCGLCIPNCPEGAIQLIDGKARLISDLFCDGLGACLGHCPEGAITIEERKAKPYDEKKVMGNIAKQGPNVIEAHLKHLKEHGQNEYFQQAVDFLRENYVENNEVNAESAHHHAAHGGCPGAKSTNFSRDSSDVGGSDRRASKLTHWPVQLHLISPAAPQYHGADVLLSADCVAYALGDFHKDYLKGKALAIACPKLDEGQEIYIEKIKSLIDDAKINTLTVMIMEVPCCKGLLNIAQQAASQASRKVPIKCLIVGIKGDILNEQ